MGLQNDCYFAKGSTHKICEDYAFTYREGDYAAAFIGDGCSGSPHTDSGARLLVHAAVQQIPSLWDASPEDVASRLGKRAVRRASVGARAMGLPFESLDATLAVAWYSQDRFSAVVYGDGAVIYRHGLNLHLVEAIYPSNTPAYLSYQLDQARDMAFQKMAAPKYIRHTCIGTEEHTVEERQQPAEAPLIVEPPVTASMIAVVSDGISTFQGRDRQRLNAREIARSWTAFRATKGAFVTRRMQAFTKQCRREGIQHLDDIAFAGLLHDG